MITAEDIKKLIKEGEDLHLEVKACKDKLPKDVWETYSAFANTRGGVIILGVTEHKDKPLEERFEFTGVSDSYKVITDFFNIVNNKQKVNAWRTLGLSHPNIHEEGEVNEVCLTLPLTKANLSKDENTVENSTVNSTINRNKVENSTINSTINGNKVENSTVNPIQESEISITKKILSLIQDHPDITIEEMVKYLGKERNTINYQIKKLKDANLIERLGSKKTGMWRIISNNC